MTQTILPIRMLGQDIQFLPKEWVFESRQLGQELIM
jgi:hypothetical protein